MKRVFMCPCMLLHRRESVGDSSLWRLSLPATWVSGPRTRNSGCPDPGKPLDPLNHLSSSTVENIFFFFLEGGIEERVYFTLRSHDGENMEEGCCSLTAFFRAENFNGGISAGVQITRRQISLS